MYRRLFPKQFLLIYWYLQEEMEDEMKRLRMELKQTIVMYHAAYKEAVTAKQKVRTR